MTSDRDMLFYWAYALGSFGAGGSLFFITPRSAVRSRPRYQRSVVTPGENAGGEPKLRCPTSTSAIQFPSSYAYDDCLGSEDPEDHLDKRF